MNTNTKDGHEPDIYRVFLLRLWSDKHGPLHASLQAAGSTAPLRFADVDALIAFLQDVAREASPATQEQASTALHRTDTETEGD